MSLLSVHVGADVVQTSDFTEKQDGPTTTRGRCITASQKPELQSMEGTLERKQKLQFGGKKAASRGWSSFHAVLHRRTLCFYQDRKDTLRRSACGLPLNLLGAECSPAPDYTKKPNCFRLQLRDGSEYLLNASSRFMMKKWMMKIHANTSQTESLCVPADSDVSLKPSQCDVTSTFPRHKPPGAAQTKEIVVLTREFGHVQQSGVRRGEESAAAASSCCDDDDDDGDEGDEGGVKQTMTHRLSGASRENTSVSPLSSLCGDQDWLSNKRRSHSFTSATFQKIKPVWRPAGDRGVDRGSNYCVTLVVGDQSSDTSSHVNRNPERPLLASAGWQRDASQDAVKSYASLPRPRNKSVFKKFFGKRDV